MAAPSIAAHATTAIATNATSHTLNNPSGISAGDTLLALLVADGSVTFSSPVAENWRRLDSHGSGTASSGAVFIRRADGSEGATTAGWGTSGSENVAAVIMRFSGAGPHNPVCFNNNVGSGTSAAPNAIVFPSSGTVESADILWIAAFGSDDDDNTTPWAPSGYTELALVESDQSAASCMLGVAYKQTTASTSEDPGAFAMAASEEWFAYVIAVFPPMTDVLTWQQDHDGLGISGSGQDIGAGSSQTRWAQSFKIPTTKTVDRVKFVTYRNGSPTDDLQISIRSSRDGTILASATDDVSNTTAAWITFTFGTPVSLTGGTEYWLQIERTGSLDISNFYRLHRYNPDDASGPYEDGNLWVYNGTSWSDNSAETAFQILQQAAAAGPPDRIVPVRNLNVIQAVKRARW